jgi:hypothetical protein
MGVSYWPLEVVVNQFTWIPWSSEAVIPEMRWLKQLTIFSEPISLGEIILKPVKTHGPIRQNLMIAEKELSAEDYLSAIQIFFGDTQHILDLLSLVTSRGFKILRVRPSLEIRRKLGLERQKSFRESVRLSLLKRLKQKPVRHDAGTKGESIAPLTAYQKLIAVSRAEGYLEENVIFTTDFPREDTSTVSIDMLNIGEFKRRLEVAQRNFHAITSKRNLRAGLRFYRTSLQLNDYMVRYVLMWTALESATLVPRKITGKKKIKWISEKVQTVPGIKNGSENLEEIVKRLNQTRNRIVHQPAFAIRKRFQECTTSSLIQLDWVLYNYLLSSFELPLLPSNSSPFKR